MAISSTPVALPTPLGVQHPSTSRTVPATKPSHKSADKQPGDASQPDFTSLASLTPLLLPLAAGGGSASVTVQEQHIGTLLGSIVWPGGHYLASYLHLMHASTATAPTAASTRLCPHFSLPHSFLRGKRVIELGSGTGVVGIVAARCHPSSLVLTDLPDLLPLLSANLAATTAAAAAAHSSTAVHCLPLTWRTSLAPSELSGELARPFDVMLLSDVVYDAWDTRQSDGVNNHRRLFHTLHCFATLSPSLLVLLAYTPRREEESEFFDLLRAHGYCWTVRSAAEVVPDSVRAEQDRRVDMYLVWRNECVSGEMHRHVRDRRLSAWVSEEKGRQDELLQRKLAARQARKQSATTKVEEKR